MKNITVEWLKECEASPIAIEWFKECGKDKPVDVMDALLAENKLDLANWLIVRLLSPEDRVRYAIFAAEHVLDIYEKSYPDDKRPRVAIEKAREVLEKPDRETRDSALASAWGSALAIARAADAAADADATAGDAALASWAAIRRKIINYGVSLLDQGDKNEKIRS